MYISNSPLVSWLSIFGVRGEAYVLGVIELTTAVLLAAERLSLPLSPKRIDGAGTFIITWSFSLRPSASSNGASPQIR